MTVHYPEGVDIDTILLKVSDGNATVWANISVQVRLVDDPPVMLALPNQKVVAGEASSLDLITFVSDVDTINEKLKIHTSSKFVKVKGMNLIMDYPSDYSKTDEKVTVYLEDETSTVSRTLNITVKRTNIITVGGTSWTLILGVIIAAIVGTIIAIFVYRRLKFGWFRVKEVLLIYRDGRLIAHRGTGLKVDKDIFGGMLTAVQGLMKESMDGTDAGEIKEFEYEGMRIAIERGKTSFLAVFLEGYVTPVLRNKLRTVLEKFEEKNISTIRDWSGDISVLKGIDKMMGALLKKTEDELIAEKSIDEDYSKIEEPKEPAGP
jgi:hypothetical protein